MSEKLDRSMDNGGEFQNEQCPMTTNDTPDNQQRRRYNLRKRRCRRGGENAPESFVPTRTRSMKSRPYQTKRKNDETKQPSHDLVDEGDGKRQKNRDDKENDENEPESSHWIYAQLFFSWESKTGSRVASSISEEEVKSRVFLSLAAAIEAPHHCHFEMMMVILPEDVVTRADNELKGYEGVFAFFNIHPQRISLGWLRQKLPEALESALRRNASTLTPRLPDAPLDVIKISRVQVDGFSDARDALNAKKSVESVSNSSGKQTENMCYSWVHTNRENMLATWKQMVTNDTHSIPHTSHSIPHTSHSMPPPECAPNKGYPWCSDGNLNTHGVLTETNPNLGGTRTTEYPRPDGCTCDENLLGDGKNIVDEDDDVIPILVGDSPPFSPKEWCSPQFFKTLGRFGGGEDHPTSTCVDGEERLNSLVASRIRSTHSGLVSVSEQREERERESASGGDRYSKVRTRSMNEHDRKTNKRVDDVAASLPSGIKRACAFLPESNAAWLLKEYRELKASNKIDELCGNRDKKRHEWLDVVQRLPFGVYSSSPAMRSARVMNTGEKAVFLEDAKKEIDTVVHGMDAAKNAVLEIAAKNLTVPDAPMRSLLLEGPPGCGKTTFSKEGLRRVLKRPVRFINVGGLSDASNLVGHSYTYEGSKPGAVVRELMHAGVSDPVFVFDEVDKISNTPKGEEIVSVLMSLVDPAQNSQFSDLYLGNIPFDVSRALFVFTCNDASMVHPVLRDRVRKIPIPPMSKKDMKVATLWHLVPRVYKEYDWALPRRLSNKDNPTLDPIPTQDDDRCFEHLRKLVDKLMEGTSKYEEHGGYEEKSQGMRSIEKLLERVAMVSNIRQIKEGFPGGEGAGMKLEDVDETLKIVENERKETVNRDTVSHHHIYL